MPLLLYAYLVTETLAPFFASLLILTTILFLGRILPLFDFIINFGISLPDFIRLCAYMAPNLFLFAIPMASMLGVILCFTRMGNDNELIALKAAGIGLYRMLPAVVFFALCTSLLTGYFSTTLIPSGTTAMKKLFFQLAKEKIDKGLQEKKFSDGLPDVVIYIDQKDPKTGKWHGVYVADSRDSENPLTIIAESGFIHADMPNLLLTLQLDHGSIHQAKEDRTQTISFATYRINIPLQGPGMDDEEGAMSISNSEMTQHEITDYVSTHGRQSPESISQLIQYHLRLVLPGGCFILTILGLPLALRTRPGQRSIGVPLGLIIFICYYVILTTVKSFSAGSPLPVAITMWLPNIIFGVVTLYILRFANRESTLHLIDFFIRIIHLMQSILPGPGKKKNS
ncbi:MAG: LptF/LptG family permease [Proteobacteria bacterium]|nr:LptF/LptG family permease [Pseudomonadota bacterium]MBU4295490.1 LptF/LptG family permease [Pseudomonadota bacterium]MCG2749474.1 LptF/LptG family permease [Desulfobulbaceae bacterium]